MVGLLESFRLDTLDMLILLALFRIGAAVLTFPKSDERCKFNLAISTGFVLIPFIFFIK